MVCECDLPGWPLDGPRDDVLVQLSPSFTGASETAISYMRGNLHTKNYVDNLIYVYIYVYIIRVINTCADETSR